MELCGCIIYVLTTTYTIGKFLSKETFFSNFKLEKHWRILLCCFSYRIRIIDKCFVISQTLFYFHLSPLPLFCFLLPLHSAANYVPCNLQNRIEIVNPCIPDCSDHSNQKHIEKIIMHKSVLKTLTFDFYIWHFLFY